MRRERISEQEQRARVAALESIGLVGNALAPVLRAETRELQKRAKEEILHRLRKRYRKRVRELHPDLNGGDPVKAEQLRVLVAAWGDLERFECPLPASRRFPPGVTVVQYSSTGATTNNSTAAWDPVSYWKRGW